MNMPRHIRPIKALPAIAYALFLFLLSCRGHSATGEELQKIKKLEKHAELVELIETSRDEDIVMAAQYQLISIGPRNEKEFDYLLNTGISDSSAKKYALRALQEGHQSDPKRVLLKRYRKLLAHEEHDLKLVGITYVAYVGDKKSFKKLCNMLRDPKLDLYASMGLAKMGDPRAIKHMIEVGSDGSLEGVKLFPDATKALVEAMETIPEDTQTDQKRKNMLASTIHTLGKREDKEYLLSQRNHERRDIRLAVWEGLSYIADESLTDVFREGVSSADEDVFLTSVQGLGKCGPKGLEILEEILLAQPKLHPYRRRIVINQFIYFGNELHLPFLQKVAGEDVDTTIRERAKEAIRYIHQRKERQEEAK